VPRLFVAVWPPDDLLDEVARLARPPVAGVRWTPREQWHVTLRFLGAVENPSVVIDGLRGMRAGPVEAELGPAVGRFGNRVLHVPVAGLGPLAEEVVTVTAGVGRPPEEREFAGHLTLARVAKGARVNLGRLAGEAVSGRWTVGEVCVVESHLSPAGARYEVLESLAFSGAGRS
jgi:RNA 2',3'-cyclic 3'-phosphodiesterase